MGGFGRGKRQALTNNMDHVEEEIQFFVGGTMDLRLLLFLTLLLSFGCCVLPQSQKDSLVALYNSTAGPTKWIRKWNLSTDPCTGPWWGITCDASNTSVTRILLDLNNLVGPLPDLQLPALVSL